MCDKHDLGAPGGVIFEDDLVYVGHVFGSDLSEVYLGYVMVEPKRHVAGLGELTDPEAAAIGETVNRVSAALRRSEGAEHIYSFVLGDAVDHLHIHVVPRYPGAPSQYWGPRVDQWPEAPRGGLADIEAVVERIRNALTP